MCCADRSIVAALWVALALTVGVPSNAADGATVPVQPAAQPAQAPEKPAISPAVASATSVATAAVAELRFPDLLRTSDAVLDAPVVRSVTLPALASDQEQALVPLPPAVTTGMALLAVLGLVGSRKAIARFVM